MCELCTRCVIGLEVQSRLDISHTPEAFIEEGQNTPFLFAGFSFGKSQTCHGECAGGILEVTSYREVLHSAQAILKCLEIYLQVIIYA